MTSKRDATQWESRYRTSDPASMPWYYGRLDTDFECTLKQFNIRCGKVLDLGAGPGTQALQLARMGFRVTGVDISATAVRWASEKAKAEEQAVRFVRGNVLDLKLKGSFDLILDRGCFHGIETGNRKRYVRSAGRLLARGGLLLLKGFSFREPGSKGPHRLRPGEIRECFSDGFDVLSIRHSVFGGNKRPNPRALYCVLRRQ